MNHIMTQTTAPHISPEAQEWLGRIRAAEARNFAQRRDAEIDERAFYAVDPAVRDAYTAWESSRPAPADCPPWCNHHTYNASDSAGAEVTSTHAHKVEVGNADAYLKHDDEPGGPSLGRSAAQR